MSDPLEEYRTAAAAAGWRVDRRRGRLRVAGRDAAAFLHALVTADVAAVPDGGGAYAAYLTPQGRMITDLALYPARRSGWLVDLPPGVAPALLARLDSLIFAEDVTRRRRHGRDRARLRRRQSGARKSIAARPRRRRAC